MYHHLQLNPCTAAAAIVADIYHIHHCFNTVPQSSPLLSPHFCNYFFPCATSKPHDDFFVSIPDPPLLYPSSMNHCYYLHWPFLYAIFILCYYANVNIMRLCWHWYITNNYCCHFHFHMPTEIYHTISLLMPYISSTHLFCHCFIVPHL